MPDTSIRILVHARDQRRDVFASLLKSEKSSKNHVDRGFNFDSRTYNEWIKIFTNGYVFTSFHAKSDHHTCRREEELIASIWHPDKSGKIS